MPRSLPLFVSPRRWKLPSGVAFSPGNAIARKTTILALFRFTRGDHSEPKTYFFDQPRPQKANVAVNSFNLTTGHSIEWLE
jgi:hypothetical protein